MNKRNFLRGLIPAAVAALAMLSAGTAAADWPERPIKIVVPYPPGGLTDTVTRVVADELGRQLGTTTIVENRAGAGGQLGLQSVLQAPRDGYTLALVVPATMITLPLTNPAYPIKPLEQFEPITAAVETFLALVVDKKSGLKSLPEFAAYAKRNPGKLTYGTPGIGTSFHFNNVIMARKLGIDALHVPYTGESKMLNDIAGGVLNYGLATNAAKPFVDGGQITVLAVSSPKRVSSMPQVPTFKELGVDFLSDGWLGYAAARGTPAPIMAKLSAAFTKALRSPKVKQQLEEMGYQVVGNTPEQFTQLIQEGNARYSELLRSGAVKLN